MNPDVMCYMCIENTSEVKNSDRNRVEISITRIERMAYIKLKGQSPLCTNFGKDFFFNILLTVHLDITSGR